MKISKERFEQLKKRGRGAARFVGRGGKSTAIEAVVGAIVGYGKTIAQDKVSALGQRPWLLPAGCIAAGHFLKRKPKMAAMAPALIGAGAALLGLHFYEQRQEVAANAPVANTSGDAGMVVRFPVSAPAPALEAPPVQTDAGMVANRVYALRAS